MESCTCLIYMRDGMVVLEWDPACPRHGDEDFDTGLDLPPSAV